MNVPQFLEARCSEIERFIPLLFKGEGGSARRGRTLYRRPSSANKPISVTRTQLLNDIPKNAKKFKIVSKSNKRKDQLLEKIRYSRLTKKNRIAIHSWRRRELRARLRCRQGAHVRTLRRSQWLRVGKPIHATLSTSTIFLPSHKYLSTRFHFTRRELKFNVPQGHDIVKERFSCDKTNVATASKATRKQYTAIIADSTRTGVVTDLSDRFVYKITLLSQQSGTLSDDESLQNVDKQEFNVADWVRDALFVSLKDAGAEGSRCWVLSYRGTSGSSVAEVQTGSLLELDCGREWLLTCDGAMPPEALQEIAAQLDGRLLFNVNPSHRVSVQWCSVWARKATNGTRVSLFEVIAPLQHAREWQHCTALPLRSASTTTVAAKVLPLPFMHPRFPSMARIIVVVMTCAQLPRGDESRISLKREEKQRAAHFTSAREIHRRLVYGRFLSMWESKGDFKSHALRAIGRTEMAFLLRQLCIPSSYNNDFRLTIQNFSLAGTDVCNALSRGSGDAVSNLMFGVVTADGRAKQHLSKDCVLAKVWVKRQKDQGCSVKRKLPFTCRPVGLVCSADENKFLGRRAAVAVFWVSRSHLNEENTIVVAIPANKFAKVRPVEEHPTSERKRARHAESFPVEAEWICDESNARQVAVVFPD